ncbi:DNA helicase HerA-like ATPase [Chryseobacterium defluvii]|uniref:DNA helicase HerA-like ATPase n=1 Tax=Chryseobacterium defluvii TaxID=160396 RepID=A0A840K9Z1_9FLAO|nr:ATP-binding protein [Chryseobacterium defluvii]MBB4804798.1 DNA helicase HerA-like ATPase [Chryseobacterium defluvii]
MKKIGKIIATEKVPTTIDEFFFWTDKHLVLKPFDVVKVEHIKNSVTFGVVEEISHLTDGASFLAGYISSDFGEVEAKSNSQRIGMNYVKAKVVANSKNIYTPVLDGCTVSLADEKDVKKALGLDNVKNPLACGVIEMYEDEDKITVPVHFNSHFLIGPEGAHLNISGISGLASKTSYAMFLMKAIQEQYIKNKTNESVAFVLLNVKGRDLLAIDEANDELLDEDIKVYKDLGIEVSPFKNVKYYYPYSKDVRTTTYADVKDVESQKKLKKAFQYKYLFEDDKESLDLLFSNIDDPTQSMESIVNYIISGEGVFNGVRNWEELKDEIKKHQEKGDNGKDKTISVLSWRKFYRLFRKTLERNKDLFANTIKEENSEVRLQESIKGIKKNDIHVIDIAKLDEESQGFVFGDVMRAIYDLKLGQITGREESEIPSKIVIFIDELNKYGSKDVPKNSPILRQLLDITERGRSLGIILFAAEQFKSDIHDRVKGNCATHAYGRTNAIEISKPDYQFVPPVYKSMLTRLKQGEYILQNPVFRSLLNIKFPRPLYKQFKNG